MIWAIFAFSATLGVLMSFVVVRTLSFDKPYGQFFVANAGAFVGLLPFVPIFIALDIPDEPALLLFVAAGGIFRWLYCFWRRTND